jgi:DNA repair exonuclease SbcCD ATPase subunit
LEAILIVGKKFVVNRKIYVEIAFFLNNNIIVFMKNLKFKIISAQNFMPFGPEGIRLDFSQYQNIILIRGENRDAKQIDPAFNFSDEFKISSNGSGKSSIQEVVSWTLFGRTIKRPEKVKAKSVVHFKVGKDCKTEVLFDDYRVVRTRSEGGNDNKNSLRLWKSDQGIWDKSTELTQGTMAMTQKEIENIIGLSYDSFVNICVFTDDQRNCFLECENKQKREIVENLLSLGEYREWSENAKNLKKEVKSKIDLKSKEYNILLNNKDDAKRRLDLSQKKDQDWKSSKKNEITVIEKSIESKIKELTSTDAGSAIIAYQEAQAKIKEINENLPNLETTKDSLLKNLQAVQNKETEQKNEAQELLKQYNDFSNQAKIKLSERKKKESEILDLQSNNPGTNCEKCRGLIEKENIDLYVSKLKDDIGKINLEINSLMESASEISKSIEDLKQRQEKVKKMLSQLNTKISGVDIEIRSLMSQLTAASKVREPKVENSEALLEQQKNDLESQLEQKKLELAGRSPFQDIIDNDIVEMDKVSVNISEKEKEIKDLEEDLPYFDYWIAGFGEHGIRKWVIEGIIPELNNRINYWLQFLIDNRITLKFDNELNEKIERNPVDGDPYVYDVMSTGQRRRLNLAVSQAFAHIMTISTGSIPSIVFLDEVSTNVDPLGVQGIYNMICELAEDKQVFITTHDPDLLKMLQGSSVINLMHEDGFTKLT